MKKFKLMPLLACLWVDAQAEPPAKPLQLEAELGVLLTAGNTASTASSTRLDVKNERTQWRDHVIFEGLYKKDEVELVVEDLAVETNQVTAERYFLSGQTDYKLDQEYRGLFLFASYEEDKFSGYEFQSALAAGYSDRLFNRSSSYLEYSVGPGYAFSRTDEVLDDDGNFVDNQHEDSAMIRVSAFYQYEFSEQAKFTQSLSADAALESGANTKSKSVSAVTANINDSFALKASVTVSHNSEVPDNRKSTDTTTALTLVYSY